MIEPQDDTAELARMLDATQRERDAYRSALQRIADCDHRGNRSQESTIAHNALRTSGGPEAPWLCRCGVHNHWQRTACGVCDRKRVAP